MQKFINLLVEHWEQGIGIGLILYEIIARLLKTEKSHSILNFVFKILNFVIPNLNKDGGRHPIKPLLILILMMAFASVSVAQNNSVFKGAVSINTDSTTFKTYVANQQTSYGNLGALYYNEQTNKWRIYGNSVWSDLGVGGGGGGSAFWPLAGTGTITNDVIMDGTLFDFTETWDDVISTYSGYVLSVNNDLTINALNDIQIQSDNNFDIAAALGLNITGNLIDIQATTGNLALSTAGNFSIQGIGASIIQSDDEIRVEATNGIIFDNSIQLSITNSVPITQFSSPINNFNNGSVNFGVGVTDVNFESGNFNIWNPARTFKYNFVTGNIAANRTVTYPTFTVTNNNLLGSATADIVGTRVPFYSGSTGITSTDAGFTFSTTNDVLTVGRLVTLSTTTTPAIGVGSFAGDPSSLANGDLWYNSTSNNLRCRINGASVSLGAGGGITNTAAANEIAKSDGTNLVPSGIFSTTAGNILLGNSTGAGTQRTITPQGSGADISTRIDGKGSSGVSLLHGNGTSSFAVGASSYAYTIASGASYTSSTTSTLFADNTGAQTFTIGASTTGIADGEGNNIIIQAGSGNNSSGNNNGGNLTLQSGASLGSGTSGDVIIETRSTGGTLMINDGSNEQMGLAVLVGGTVTVNNTKVTANSRIFLTTQILGGTIGIQYISARVAGTSFTITSSNVLDTSSVGWLIIEPN